MRGDRSNGQCVCDSVMCVHSPISQYICDIGKHSGVEGIQLEFYFIIIIMRGLWIHL